MPKEIKPSTAHHRPITAAPYPAPSTSGQRNAAIWSAADDEILLQARASGLNWQPISSRHFPNKTANACRKRHERLIERRHVEDWDAQKLELLAQEYMAVRKEMWEVLASRVSERWAIVEAKASLSCRTRRSDSKQLRANDPLQCLEKGLKNLQSTARTAQRRASASQSQTFDERGISDHNSDSGVYLGSDAEMEAGEVMNPAGQHTKSASWHAHPTTQQSSLSNDHVRSRSLPQPLPLYQPPPPIVRAKRTFGEADMTDSPDEISFARTATSFSRYSPDSNGRGGISIQSVLSPMEPHRI